MSTNKQQIESVNQQSSNPGTGTPVQGAPVGTSAKAVSGRTWKRKSRAIPYGLKLLGYQTRARLLTAAGHELAGEIVAFGTDETVKDGHLIFRVKCLRCGKDDNNIRSDNFWAQNKSCGCGAKDNRDHQIELVITAIGAAGEDLAKAMESGSLPSQGDRVSHQASLAEILEHFGLTDSKDANTGGIRPRASKTLIKIGWAVKFAASRIQNRWKVATWQRLGEVRVLQIASAVRDFGVKWTAANLCDGCSAVARVCLRWVLQGFPQIDTLVAA